MRRIIFLVAFMSLLMLFMGFGPGFVRVVSLLWLIGCALVVAFGRSLILLLVVSALLFVRGIHG